MDHNTFSWGTVILAGGASQRMGFPKAYLIIDNLTFLEKIIDAYSDAGCTNIVVVINHELCTRVWTNYLKALSGKARFITNTFPSLGRFYSVKLGMEAMESIDHCFIQNIDNPFVNADLIKDILSEKNSEGYTVPVFKGKAGHPVLLSRQVIDHIREMESVENNLRDVLSSFARKELITDQSGILVNINTQEDYHNHVTAVKKVNA